MKKLALYYHYLKTLILYRPFVKKGSGRFIVMNPILFSPRHFLIGERVLIRDHARLEAVTQYQGIPFNPEVRISSDVSIEQNLHLTCACKISIGSNTAIAANVSITDINHPYEDIALPPEKQALTTKEVIIGSDCKIYNNVVILPGTVLGKHCVVGANSVVLGRQYEDFSIITGAPAKVVKRYSRERGEWLKTDENGNFYP